MTAARALAKTAPKLALSLRERLPAQFAAVGDLLGDRALLRLLEAHGGTRLSVPSRVAPFDPLAVLLGAKPAERLAREFGGGQLQVPLCKPWRALMLRREGCSYAAIARRLGMHEQSVYMLVHRREGATAAERASLRQLRLSFE